MAKYKVAKENKICSECGVEKPIADFPKKSRPGSYEKRCRPCHRKFINAKFIYTPEIKERCRRQYLKTRKLVSQLKLFGNQAGRIATEETREIHRRRHKRWTQEKITKLVERINSNREYADSLMAKMDADIFCPIPGKAVYAVTVQNIYCAGAEHLLYIGSSMNMQNRRSRGAHPYKIAVNRFRSITKFVTFKYYYTENYLEDEALLIQVFSPPMNKILNHKKSTDKTLRRHYNAKQIV